VFAPAGQTELRRWLRALGERDAAPPISRSPALAHVVDEELDIEDEDIVFEAGDTAVDTIGVGRRVGNKTTPSLAIAARAIEQAAARPFEIPAEVPSPGTGSVSISEPRPGRRRWLLAGLLGGATVGAGLFAVLRPRISQLLLGTEEGPPPPAPSGTGGRAEVAAAPAAVPVAPVDAAPVAPDVRPETGRPIDAGKDLRPDAHPDADAGDDEEDEESLLRHSEPDVADKVIGEESAAIAPATREPSRPRPAARPEARPNKPPPAPTPVRIESRPDGAVVKLGSRVFGRAPLTLRFNPGVTYELVFVKSGYVTSRKRFNVSTRGGQKVTATLKKKPQRRRSFFERLFGR
jgi:hypothetical protein